MNLTGDGIVSRIGGKKNLAERIVNVYFPKNYKNLIYVEPFVGGCNVFFFKELSKKNIINDLDTDLILVYKGYKKYDAEKIMNNINGKYSKEDFKKIKNSNPTDEFNKFIRQLKLFRLSFFGLCKAYNNDGNISTNLKKINEIKNKVDHAIILNKSYEYVIEKYDSTDTFFYLDPPYDNSKGLYEHFEIDMNNLFNILDNIEGKFLLSFSNNKEVKTIFKKFDIIKIKTFYESTHKIKTEILIKNY